MIAKAYRICYNPCIDTPHISDIPVDPGLTNVLITGDNTESRIPGEGVSYYDIRFTASVPGTDEKNQVNLIMDVEAQKKPNPGYDLVTRGIYDVGVKSHDTHGFVLCTPTMLQNIRISRGPCPASYSYFGGS